MRRKLSALSSLFEYLCECNAVTHNPVKGVKRPKVETYEGYPVDCVSFVLNGELKATVVSIENMAGNLPDHIEKGTTREVCHNLPVPNFSGLGTLELSCHERLHQIYAFLTGTRAAETNENRKKGE